MKLSIHLSVLSCVYTGCFILLAYLHSTDAIDCYNCTNIRNTSECHSIQLCPSNAKGCMIYTNGSGSNRTYTMGCDVNDMCQELTTPPTTVQPTPATTDNNNITDNNITDVDNNTTTIDNSVVYTTVPPDMTTTNATDDNNTMVITTAPTIPQTTLPASPASLVGKRFVPRADPNSCSKCCNTDSCNKHLCDEKLPVIPTKPAESHVCNDQRGTDFCESAKQFFDACRNISIAKTICKKTCDLCDLVDGNWSEWGNWSSCDVTCGNGTRSRVRDCDSPAPKAGGDNCTGSADETETCIERDCPVDGDWTSWTKWSDCSVTCGVGLQKRLRNCSDPFPDGEGLFCLGDSVDVNICYESHCQDGEWQDWSSWTECSVSCDTGIKSRHRNCSESSFFGHTCVGDALENELCQEKSCAHEVPAFLVTGVSTNGEDNSTLILTKVITNVGDAYNQTTGKFQCEIPGIYSFFVSIEKQPNVNQAFCKIMHNDNSTIYVGARSAFIHDQVYQQASNSAILQLDKGDFVYLGGCSDPSTFTVRTTFSGSLIS
ncbi:hypothetical protein ACF0H5_023465 [Mactra antiquata]